MAMTFDRDRLVSILGVALVHLLIGYALIVGLRISAGRPVAESITLVDLIDPPPPAPAVQPREPPRRVTRNKPGGGSAPPDLRARATEIVAPEPVILLPVPPPVAVADKAGPGAAVSSGDSSVAGPGTGSGGLGRGRGGGSGDGEGLGDGGGGLTPPRWVRGRIRDSDYPAGAGEAGISGRVEVRYRVGTDGRVTQCGIARSSGNPELDAVTCRLIEQRFRYEPSRDGAGRPVPSWIIQNHEWIVESLPPDEDEPAPRRERLPRAF